MTEGKIILGIFLYNEIRTGAHRRYLELIDGLVKKGHKVFLLINSKLIKNVNCSSTFIPLNVEYKHGQFYPVSLVFRSSIKKNINKITSLLSSVDWILIFSTTNVSSAKYLKNYFKSKVIYGHRSNPTREYLTFLNLKKSIIDKFVLLLKLFVSLYHEKNISKLADKIIFQSQYDLNDFSKRNKEVYKKSFIIGGNIGPPRFKQEFKNINKSTSVNSLLFVGHTGDNKGLKYLIEAIHILKIRGLENLKVDILGHGRIDNHLSYIEKYDLSNIFFFHGKVENPFYFMARDDLMVVPSVADSFPDTILEALHSGIPVIGSKVGGIPEMLLYDELLFNPADSVDLSNKLFDIITKTDKYLEVRTLCSSLVDNFYFDWIEKWNFHLH